MSSVAIVRWYDKDNNLVNTQFMGNSCLACFYLGRYKIKAHSMQVVFADDEFAEDMSDWSEDAVDTDWEIPWQDFSHPLIQALSPGMEKVGEACVKVLLEGIPFDQIICALRIIREYQNFEYFRKGTLEYGSMLDDDYYPCIAGINQSFMEGVLKKKGIDRFSRVTTPGFIVDTEANPAGFEKYVGLSRVVAHGQAMDRLEKGIINPGWHPEWNEGFGYVKSHESIPQEFMYYPLDMTDASRPHKVIQAALTAYKEKYGKYPHFTIDHSLCVYQGGHIED